jgi:hypothetical protein
VRFGGLVVALALALPAGGVLGEARASSSPTSSEAPSGNRQIGREAQLDNSDMDSSSRSADTSGLSTDELSAVAQHFTDSLSEELYDNFQLFLYVSKAETGPWAQHLFVFQKQPDGSLAFLDNWPVSTGRERVEYNSAGDELPSFTPQGYYELDPKRMFVDYTSAQWGEPMPYSMFFQWKKDGKLTGLAIHAATDDEVAQLGSRASAGCVRLPPQAARDLFNLVQTRYRGAVPKFETDPRTLTIDNNGALLHKRDGSFELADGYKVLVYVEDYGGNDTVASAQ